MKPFKIQVLNNNKNYKSKKDLKHSDIMQMAEELLLHKHSSIDKLANA